MGLGLICIVGWILNGTKGITGPTVGSGDKNTQADIGDMLMHHMLPTKQQYLTANTRSLRFEF